MLEFWNRLLYAVGTWNGHVCVRVVVGIHLSRLLYPQETRVCCSMYRKKPHFHLPPNAVVAITGWNGVVTFPGIAAELEVIPAKTTWELSMWLHLSAPAFMGPTPGLCMASRLSALSLENFQHSFQLVHFIL